MKQLHKRGKNKKSRVSDLSSKTAQELLDEIIKEQSEKSAVDWNKLHTQVAEDYQRSQGDQK